MDPAIVQSLQEIASFLLLVHDYYLKGVHGSDVLVPLTVLIKDIGLSNSVSILDSERLRREVMGSNDSAMGYELFYDWLRGVGQLVFKGPDAGGRRAVHHLITKHIVPYASKIKPNHRHSSSSSGLEDTNQNEEGDGKVSYSFNMPYFTDAEMGVMVRYADFIQHWFHEIACENFASNVSCNCGLWAQIQRSGQTSASFDGIYKSFREYGICPALVSDGQIENVLLLCVNSASGEAQQQLAFPAFLYFLELISESVPVSAAAPGDGSLLVTFLREATAGKLKRLAHLFAVPQMSNRLVEAEDVLRNKAVVENAAAVIPPVSLLWWLRQAGLIDAPLEDITAVLKQLSSLQRKAPSLFGSVGAGVKEGGKASATGTTENARNGAGGRASQQTGVLCSKAGEVLRLLTDGFCCSEPRNLGHRFVIPASTLASVSDLASVDPLDLARRQPQLLHADPRLSLELESLGLGLLYSLETAAALAAHLAQSTAAPQSPMRAAVLRFWRGCCVAADLLPQGDQERSQDWQTRDTAEKGQQSDGLPRLLPVYAIVEHCSRLGLVPTVVDEQTLRRLCTVLMGEEHLINPSCTPSSGGGGSGSDDAGSGGGVGEEPVISQGRVVEALYAVAFSRYAQLEQLRLQPSALSTFASSSVMAGAAGVPSVMGSMASDQMGSSRAETRTSTSRPSSSGKARQVLDALLFLLNSNSCSSQGRLQLRIPTPTTSTSTGSSSTSTTTVTASRKGQSQGQSQQRQSTVLGTIGTSGRKFDRNNLTIDMAYVEEAEDPDPHPCQASAAIVARTDGECSGAQASATASARSGGGGGGGGGGGDSSSRSRGRNPPSGAEVGTEAEKVPGEEVGEVDFSLSLHGRGVQTEFSRHPLRDVALLLVHYPLSTFALSPWTVSDLLASVTAPSNTNTITSSAASNVSSSASNGAPAGLSSSSREAAVAAAAASGDSPAFAGHEVGSSGSGAALTTLLRRFSSHFASSPDKLSTFFAQFYSPAQQRALGGSGASRTAASEGDKEAEAMFKQRALRDPLLDLMMGEHALRLLLLNSDLLRWEYAHCLARFRTSNDPLSDAVVQPILSGDVVEERPADALLPVSSALAWARAVARSSRVQAEAHLAEITCLAGHSSQVLTFSTFVVFAVRCFADPLVDRVVQPAPGALGAEQVEAEFVSVVRGMLHQFSEGLSRVQHALRMKVLRPLFGSSKDAQKDPLVAQEVHSCLSAAIKIFNASISIASATTTAAAGGAVGGAGMGSGIGAGAEVGAGAELQLLPPRPPLVFWDAPRFVMLCKHLGVAAKFDWSMELLWVAFGLRLQQDAVVTGPVSGAAAGGGDEREGNGRGKSSSKALDAWDISSVVPPVPVSAGPEEAHALLLSAMQTAQALLRSCKQSTHFLGGQAEPTALFFKTIVPAICTYASMRCADDSTGSARRGQLQGSSVVSLEDLLRYGGAAGLHALSDLQVFLRLSFYALMEKACSGGRGGSSGGGGMLVDAFGNPASCAVSLATKPAAATQCEVPLHLLCRFFACFDILRAGAVAVQAKRALHIRLRPVFSTALKAGSGAGAGSGRRGHRSLSMGDVATLSYVEFEELFVRCAFLAWQASGAFTDPTHQPTLSTLLAQAHLRRKDASSGRGPGSSGGNNGVNTSGGAEGGVNKSWGVEPATLKVAQEYVAACEQSAREAAVAARGSGKARGGRKAVRGKKSSWGVDFLRPYGAILKANSEFSTATVANFRAMGGVSDAVRPVELLRCLEETGSLPTAVAEQPEQGSGAGGWHVEKREHGSFSAAVDLTSRSIAVSTADSAAAAAATSVVPGGGAGDRTADSAAGVTWNEGGGLSDIMARRLHHTISDPAMRLPERGGGIGGSRHARDRDKTGRERLSSVGAGAVGTRSGAASGGRSGGAMSPSPRDKDHSGDNGSVASSDNEGGAAGGGTGLVGPVVAMSPKLKNSKEIILSSSERFHLMQESSEQFVVALDSLLVGTKEALWPVYATYCSCGDSLEPGKLSGPNLFSLLSKLGVLTDGTLLSDVGILLHQIAEHAFCRSPLEALSLLYEDGDPFESPSLTFEEFLVFLCAFSQLRFEGVMMTPALMQSKLQQQQQHQQQGGHGAEGAPAVPPTPSSSVTSPENWFKQWQLFMGSSNSFRRLLVECVLPILKRQTLLAFPEDARLRDRFCCVFSLEVLVAVEGVEGPLLRFFEMERKNASKSSQSTPSLPSRTPTSASGIAATGGGGAGEAGAEKGIYGGVDEIEISAIVTALKRINLIPKVIQESQVLQLIKDVLPEKADRRGREHDRVGNLRRSFSSSQTSSRQSFPPSSSSVGSQASGEGGAAGVGTPPAGVGRGGGGSGALLLFPQWEWVLSVVAYQAVEMAVQQSPVQTDPEVR